jgi:hypothetical protein
MLHNALLAAGAHSRRYVLDGADHGDLAFMGDEKSGLPWSAKETMGIIVDFLARNLGCNKRQHQRVVPIDHCYGKPNHRHQGARTRSIYRECFVARHFASRIFCRIHLSAYLS